MGKTFIQGLVLLAAGIVALILNNLLNLGLGSITLGLAVGGILGLVSDGGPVGRVGSFVVGLVIAMVVYVVSILLLNTSFGGQVVGILIALGLVTLICGLTSGRLPLWAALAGIVLVAGAYGQAFADNPAGILTELPQYVTQALVPAALGFLATIFVADRAPQDASAAGATGLDQPPSTPPVQTGEPQSAGASSAPNLNKEV